MSEAERIRITKARVLRRLKDTEDPALWDHLDALLEPGSDPWWQHLPPKVAASVKRGIKQADKGEFVSEDDVRKAREQWRRP